MSVTTFLTEIQTFLPEHQASESEFLIKYYKDIRKNVLHKVLQTDTSADLRSHLEYIADVLEKYYADYPSPTMVHHLIVRLREEVTDFITNFLAKLENNNDKDVLCAWWNEKLVTFDEIAKVYGYTYKFAIYNENAN